MAKTYRVAVIGGTGVEQLMRYLAGVLLGAALGFGLLLTVASLPSRLSGGSYAFLQGPSVGYLKMVGRRNGLQAALGGAVLGLVGAVTLRPGGKPRVYVIGAGVLGAALGLLLVEGFTGTGGMLIVLHGNMLTFGVPAVLGGASLGMALVHDAKSTVWGGVAGAALGFALGMMVGWGLASWGFNFSHGRGWLPPKVVGMLVGLAAALLGLVVGTLASLVWASSNGPVPLNRGKTPEREPPPAPPPTGPPDPAALLRAADRLEREGDWEEGLTQYGRASDLWEEALTHYRRAADLLGGQPEGALAERRIRELRDKLNRPGQDPGES